MKGIVGCAIEALGREPSRAWVDWILGTGAAPRAVTEPTWLLAHCDAGVTWGRLDGGRWRLGSDAFPDLCPRPAEAAIQQLRIFWRATEVLIWRSEEGLRGRVLRDGPPAADGDPARPDDQERLLLARHSLEHRDGFTRVGNGTGAEQALPLVVAGDPPSPWPRLVVRHYFARDTETGAVRVTATRLVEVR